MDKLDLLNEDDRPEKDIERYPYTLIGPFDVLDVHFRGETVGVDLCAATWPGPLEVDIREIYPGDRPLLRYALKPKELRVTRTLGKTIDRWLEGTMGVHEKHEPRTQPPEGYLEKPTTREDLFEWFIDEVRKVFPPTPEPTTDPASLDQEIAEWAEKKWPGTSIGHRFRELGEEVGKLGGAILDDHRYDLIRPRIGDVAFVLADIAQIYGAESLDALMRESLDRKRRRDAIRNEDEEDPIDN